MLDIVSNNIVVNNNYTGIQILDSRLNLVRCIEPFDDIAIYSLYKHHSNKEIILYCPENECLVHVNLDSGDFRKIELDNQFSEVVFSSIYLWKNEEVMFTDYRGHFYRLCIESGAIRTVDLNSIKTCYTSFYRFWDNWQSILL
ncbi:parallel beta-helix repeat (two copies) [Thermoactinomyces sp. DSM 45892]|nr:parallel beta-helix repeat (two copies) [Thermoactinomyces sp. DSM 45892]